MTALAVPARCIYPSMTPDDRETSWELDRYGQRWRWELERRAREIRWRADTQARRTRDDLDRRVRDARLELARARDDARHQAHAAAPVWGTGGPGPDWQALDDKLLAAALPVAVVLALPLLVGHLSALVLSGGWPRYPINEAPGVVWRAVTHPADPGRAWKPVNTGAQPPGPVGWWATFVVVTALAAGAALAVAAARRRGARADALSARAVVRRLALGRSHEGRLVVGTSGRLQLGLRDRHSLLVIGPAHAGKTSGVTIPAVLEWPGPAVVASTKGHMIDETIGWRSHQGEVHVFDPAGVTRYPKSGWSLLAGCTTWQGAIRTAWDLTAAATASMGAAGDLGDPSPAGGGDLGRTSMAMSLAPYLFAAVVSGRSVAAAAEWIEREERDEVLEVLRMSDRDAAQAHEAAFVRADQARSSFLHLMHRVLSVYEDPVVAASLERHEIVPAELLDGGHHTLYLTAPEHDQVRFRPLGATVVRQVLAAAYELSAAAAGPVDPPLLLVLDHAVGVAPVDDLGAVASTGAARGVQVVSVFQDLSQIGAHYGDASGLVVRNHRARLVMPSGYGPDPAAERAGLSLPSPAPRLADGEAALFYGNAPPVRVALRPWFRDRELRRRAETAQDLLVPVGERVPVAPAEPTEQAGAWLRRGSARPVGAPETLPDRPSREFTELYGSLDDDTVPLNVTALDEGRRWFRHPDDG